MISPNEPWPATACPAAAALTNAEARDMNILPGADFEADTEPLGCEFAVHDAEWRHAACAQVQFIAGKLILWWLLWDDAGYRELRIAPGCNRSVVDESCLLIWDHPGECDQDCGWTREELKEALDAARKEGDA
ncbi:hypothetical protein [Streptomyces sp. NPDC001508]|uniref:hypothetical protein n=1 Tax=Streptomyces sp. NPDC001508 TaxID=3154656 RepID=UPI00331CD5D2